jgi:hypothetical protein
MGIEEGKEVQTRTKKTFNKVIAENNFLSLEKEMTMQVKETFMTPNTQNQKTISPRHVIVQKVIL